MKCFYHTDLDGICSGFWVKHYMNHQNTDDVQEYIPINYGYEFPFDSITKNEKIFIVDYSIEPAEMSKLLKITKNVTWIDHHISAINKYKDFKTKINGLRLNGIAGCALTFLYLYRDSNIDQYDSIPLFTKIIADHDVWKFKYGDDTKNFITALQSMDNNKKLTPCSSIFKKLYQDVDIITELISSGEKMRVCMNGYYKSCVNGNSYSKIFEGHNALILNIPNANSAVFDSIKSDKYDIYIIYNRQSDGRWRYSIYSDKVDVSKIAKKFGGGGHSGASGFVSDNLIC